jgi:DNA-binding NarL/FixJ family response regulator
VEDNAPMRRVVNGVLGMHEGWQVGGEASNGREAVEKFPQIRPDITVMDLKMPEMDGLEAAKAIIRDFPDAAILLLTVYSSDELVMKARQVGIKGVCPKSEMWRVLDAIDALLAGSMYFPDAELRKSA